MTAHRLGFIAFASIAMLFPAGSRAQEDYEPVIVREAPGGQATVDLDSVRARGGNKTGWLTLKVDIELAKPFHYAAQEITRETQTQDWDCDGRRYRIVLRVFSNSTGQYVYSERGRSPWKAVPEQGPDPGFVRDLAGARRRSASRAR